MDVHDFTDVCDKTIEKGRPYVLTGMDSSDVPKSQCVDSEMEEQWNVECGLCGWKYEMVIPPVVNTQEELFSAWKVHCADSLSEVLGLGFCESEEFRKAYYCPKCFQLSRDVDFILRSLRSFETRLAAIKVEILSIYNDKAVRKGPCVIPDDEDLLKFVDRRDRLARRLRQKDKKETEVEISRLSESAVIAASSDDLDLNEDEDVKSFGSEDGDGDSDSSEGSDGVESYLVSSEDDTCTTGGENDDYEAEPSRGNVGRRKDKRILKSGAKTASKNSFPCPAKGCDVRLRYQDSFNNIARHLFIAHCWRERISCQFCGLTFLEKDEAEFEAHELRHREADVPFSCVVDSCVISFTNFQDLKKHVFEEHEETALKCSLCPGKIFKTPAGLRNHHYNLHSEQSKSQLFCPESGCLFVTQARSTLTNHIKTHSTERPHMCHQCGATYKAAGALKRHQFTHTGEKPFKCKYCSKSFNMGHKLKNHEETHAPKLTYLCSGCGKAFRSKKNLCQHMKLHCSIEKGFLNPTLNSIKNGNRRRWKEPTQTTTGPVSPPQDAVE